jgi:uncharacterized protein
MRTPRQEAGKCPICGAPSNAEYRPFCSRRCADVDLARWLRGAYVIPGPAEERDEEARGADEDADDDDAKRH